MNHLLALIIPLIVLSIIIPKQHKIKTLHDVVEYTKFTDKLLNIMFSIALCAIIALGIIVALEGEINIMELFKDILFDIFITILTSGLITVFTYYKIFKNLPDKIEKQINDIMDTKILHVNSHTDTSNNALTAEHSKLSKEHDVIRHDHFEIKGDLKSLVADMNRRQGSNYNSEDAITNATRLQETLIKQNEIINNNKTISDLRKENDILISKNEELKKQISYYRDESKNINKNSEPYVDKEKPASIHNKLEYFDKSPQNKDDYSIDK